MVIGLGIDLVEIKRINKIWKRFGLKFAQRILTNKELALLHPAPISFLAGRFAAKEAAVKALGTGFRQGITFTCLEIIDAPNGKPDIHFLGPGKELSDRLGVKRASISLTHSKEQAAAVVILEG